MEQAQWFMGLTSTLIQTQLIQHAKTCSDITTDPSYKDDPESYRDDNTNINLIVLKKLRNCLLRFICVWSFV